MYRLAIVWGVASIDPPHRVYRLRPDLEIIALSLAAKSESIDSEKWLFEYKLQEYRDRIPNLISRRQFNDRRKKTAELCEEIRKRLSDPIAPFLI